MHSDGDFSSRKILAMYGCNSVSIAGVINGSRFFVLKTRWIRMDDRDCGMGVSSLSELFRAVSAYWIEMVFVTWAVGPGFYISRLWRLLGIRLSHIMRIQTSHHTAALR